MTENSPAAKAGIKTGDTVIKVNDQEVAPPKDLARKIALDSARQGCGPHRHPRRQAALLTVEIGTMPSDMQASEVPEPEREAGQSRWARLAVSRPEARGYRSAVEPDSPADERGIKSGDTILESTARSRRCRGPEQVSLPRAAKVATEF